MSERDESAELLAFNRRLKKSVLEVLFREIETFYLHCMPNPRLAIGRRGLEGKEEQEGIILVFGPYSTRHLSWDEEYIYCEMQFGRWEKVAIPYECVARMFDKTGQVLMQWATLVAPASERTTTSPATPVELPRAPTEPNKVEPRVVASTDAAPAALVSHETKRVIHVDFTRKKKE